MNFSKRQFYYSIGALLGALLPMLLEGREIGAFAFYMIWHAGYAAASAAMLPRVETI